MTQLTRQKEEYRIPLAEFSGVLPDILCDSQDSWGNEGLTEGEPWTF